MGLSKKLFESVVTHPTFDQIDFLLLLNKFDLFEELVEQVPLSECDWFDDFHPVISRNRSNSNRNNINNNPSLGQLAFHYIAVKFKRLYSDLTGRKLYVSLVKGLEPNSVDAALKYSREILDWDDERNNFNSSEYSVYSMDANSFSHWIQVKKFIPTVHKRVNEQTCYRNNLDYILCMFLSVLWVCAAGLVTGKWLKIGAAIFRMTCAVVFS